MRASSTHNGARERYRSSHIYPELQLTTTQSLKSNQTLFTHRVHDYLRVKEGSDEARLKLPQVEKALRELYSPTETAEEKPSLS